MMMIKRGVIYMLMMADVDIGLKRPATITLTILEKLLTVIGEVDIGPIKATLTPIIQVTMVYCCVYLLILVFLIIFFMQI